MLKSFLLLHSFLPMTAPPSSHIFVYFLCRRTKVPLNAYGYIFDTNNHFRGLLKVSLKKCLLTLKKIIIIIIWGMKNYVVKSSMLVWKKKKGEVGEERAVLIHQKKIKPKTTSVQIFFLKKPTHDTPWRTHRSKAPSFLCTIYICHEFKHIRAFFASITFFLEKKLATFSNLFLKNDLSFFLTHKKKIRARWNAHLKTPFFSPGKIEPCFGYNEKNKCQSKKKKYKKIPPCPKKKLFFSLLHKKPTLV